MARGLSYADAVKLLGGADRRLIAAFNQLTGGALSAATGGTVELLINLFDVKGELADLSGELISSLGDRLRGLSRFDRTERLTAAHCVIVLTAYFEALRETRLPFPSEGFRLGRAGQVELATGQAAASERLQAIADILNENDIPDGLVFYGSGEWTCGTA